MLYSLRRLCIVMASFGLILGSASLQAQRGRKYKAPPPSATIKVTVLKADNGKPITNAAVIFHPIEGDKDKGALELHTDDEGKALIDVIPIGDTVRLQVIANGFQTYGQDFKIDKDQMSMEVHLNRPVAEYSIYQKHNSGNGSGSSSSNNNSSGNQQNQPSQNQSH